MQIFTLGKQIKLIKYHTFSISILYLSVVIRMRYAINSTVSHHLLVYAHICLRHSEFPEENPTIDDIKQYYSVGENFETNCTSNSSIPPAKLEWWINDMPIYNAEYTIKYSTIVDPATNRETSMLGLRLPLTNEHFYRGRVKVSRRFFLVFF